MSKVFEDAYKEFAAADVPDLWDRIEAGLTEKSAPVIADPKKPAKIVTFMKRYATTAAALVCVAVLIPAIMLVGKFGLGGNKAESAAYEAAPMEMAYEAEAPAAEAPEAEMYEEAAAEMFAEEEMYEEAAAETVAEEAAAAEDAEADLFHAVEAASKTELYDEEEMVEEAEAAPEAEAEEEPKLEESAPAEADDAKKSAGEEAASKEGLVVEDAAEGLFYGNVKLKVIENSEMERFFEGTEKETFGYICRMTVLEDPEGLLQEGEELQIFVSALSSFYYVEDGVFILDLEAFDTEEGRYYTVKQFHEQIEP